MLKRYGLIWVGALVLLALAACSTDNTDTSAQAPTQTSNNDDPASPNGNADVTFVSAEQQADGKWRFSVTVRHPDTGWEDYADGWDVVLPNGEVVKAQTDDPFTRLLLHPHENEQPFTRSQSGLTIPPNITEVIVRAHDLVDGWGGETITVDLTAASGDGFEVKRN